MRNSSWLMLNSKVLWLSKTRLEIRGELKSILNPYLMHICGVGRLQMGQSSFQHAHKSDMTPDVVLTGQVVKPSSG